MNTGDARRSRDQELVQRYGNTPRANAARGMIGGSRRMITSPAGGLQHLVEGHLTSGRLDCWDTLLEVSSVSSGPLPKDCSVQRSVCEHIARAAFDRDRGGLFVGQDRPVKDANSLRSRRWEALEQRTITAEPRER